MHHPLALGCDGNFVGSLFLSFLLLNLFHHHSRLKHLEVRTLF